MSDSHYIREWKNFLTCCAVILIVLCIILAVFSGYFLPDCSNPDVNCLAKEIEMKELPILFSTEMVRAILDGRKTQTRRVIKIDDPDEWCDPIVEKDPPLYKNYGESDELVQGYGIYAFWEHLEFGDVWETHRCPYGSPGDLLYVRETWASLPHFDVFQPSDLPDYAEINFLVDGDCPAVKRWRPSIHMPKKFARIWLRVKDVRVERLQEINIEDIVREGINESFVYSADMTVFEVNDLRSHLFYERFKKLWNSINAKRGYGWDTNPWVWVVEFERIEK